MQHQGLSIAFMRENAGKCFVFLTYKGRAPNEPQEARKLYHSSCFVVEVQEQWFLITAGHVIAGISKALQGGAHCDTWELQDQTAGHAFRGGIPYPFSVDDWTIIDIPDRGIDYAVAPLSHLFVCNLLAGGVEPLTESIWGPISAQECEDWLVVGIPKESIESRGAASVAKFTLLPLIPTTAPEGAGDTAQNFYFGKIKVQPKLDSATVNNIEGMSGGPVFGTKRIDGVLRYWAIGIQSSWYKGHGVVCFCPLSGFLLALRQIMIDLQSSNRLLQNQHDDPREQASSEST